MIKGQLSLFEPPRLTSTGLKINFKKGIDLSEVDLNTPEQNLLIKKGKYIIHPTGETHPLGIKLNLSQVQIFLLLLLIMIVKQIF